jgi:Fic family protein
VSDHQVLFKIVTLRKTLEGLQGLDAKLESILTKKKPTKRIPRDSVEVSEAESGEESNLEDYEIEEGEDEEQEQEDDDEEMEDDVEDGMSNVGEVEQLLTRAEEREIRMRQAEELGERLKKINKDDIKSIVKSSKAPTKKERL